MKKFTQLVTGDSFEYQGKTYLKTGPLTACDTDNGSQRMIPRSALVLPFTDKSPAPAQIEERQLPADEVMAAFEHYHAGCLEWLRLTDEADPSLAEKIREAMALARERFLTELTKM